MSIQVKIPSGIYSLNRNGLQTKWPESLIAQALELEPEGKEIVIANPCVTSEVMSILEGHKPERHNPKLLEAGRYLNIPDLEVCSDPLYDHIDPNPNSVMNQRVFAEALTTGHLSIVMYLLDLGLCPDFGEPSQPYITPKKCRIDIPSKQQWPIRAAARIGAKQVVKRLLLHPQVKPEAIQNLAIQLASQNGHTAVVALLLEDKRVDPTVDDNFSLAKAVEYNHADTVKVLLDDGRVSQNNGIKVGNSQIISVIEYASERGFIDVIIYLLQKPIFIANGGDALTKACRNGFLEICRLLLASPQVDPTYDRYNLSPSRVPGLDVAIGLGNPAMVHLFLQHPKVRATYNRDACLQMASKTPEVMAILNSL
jgi:ankyrin repeat protein